MPGARQLTCRLARDYDSLARFPSARDVPIMHMGTSERVSGGPSALSPWLARLTLPYRVSCSLARTPLSRSRDLRLDIHCSIFKLPAVRPRPRLRVPPDVLRSRPPRPPPRPLPYNTYYTRYGDALQACHPNSPTTQQSTDHDHTPHTTPPELRGKQPRTRATRCGGRR
jgi:hypothetical protein